MNFLFLSHKYPREEKNSCLEKDFIKALEAKGDKVYVITPLERRFNKETHLYRNGSIEILYVKTGNRTKKYNLFEKILTILMTPYLIKRAQKKYWPNIKIDYVVGYTPFMSNLSLLKYFKNLYKSKTILFLWDIMPQTAKDMGVIKSDLIFNWMKKNELKVYKLMDRIIVNCNEAKNYLLQNGCKCDKKLLLIRNPEKIIKKETLTNKIKIREKYGYLPEDKVFVFGGNMGMLQNLNNLLDLAKEKLSEKNIKFVLIGDGKDQEKLIKRVEDEKILNVKILDVIPKHEYDDTIGAFDGGMIVLSEKNTVPNFPTKVTAYLKLGMPMFGILDRAAGRGLGKYMDDNNIGTWAEAGELENTVKKFDSFVRDIDNGAYSSKSLFDLYSVNFDVDKAVKYFKEMI